eukprot:TRINITY_DN23077_c0_g1_i1.p2 TRINITY_DN23077_c0_g1~~TRINITY_DN23077_c0_g1_i1.p2  ORF type:complete len:251 (+),score=89.39 TRINITY_DN23077_c0_g1_i1:81-833(+)
MEPQPADGEESAVGQPGNTLLDVVLQKLNVETVPPKEILSRVVFAGNVLSQDEPIGAFFEELMGAEMGYPAQGQPHFTGILVESPRNFLHFLEGTPKMLLKYLTDMRVRMKSNEDISSVLQDICIVAYTDDIVERSYRKWTTIEQSAPGEAPKLEEEPLASSIVDTIGGLMELGKLIYQKQELQMMQFLASVKTSHPETLPGIETIAAYVGPFGKELCLSLDEYLEVYGQPIDLCLAGEKIWPVPPPLHY